MVLTLDPLESLSLGGVMSIGRFARLAGLSIGALPVTLEALVHAYTVLARDGLLSDPLQILEAVVPPRKRIHGIFQRDGSNSRQSLPDFRPQIERFGRELVNQEIPGRMDDAAAALSHGLGSLTPLK